MRKTKPRHIFALACRFKLEGLAGVCVKCWEAQRKKSLLDFYEEPEFDETVAGARHPQVQVTEIMSLQKQTLAIASHPFDDVDADFVLLTCDNTDFYVS